MCAGQFFSKLLSLGVRFRVCAVSFMLQDVANYKA